MAIFKYSVRSYLDSVPKYLSVRTYLDSVRTNDEMPSGRRDCKLFDLLIFRFCGRIEDDDDFTRVDIEQEETPRVGEDEDERRGRRRGRSGIFRGSRSRKSRG